MCSTFQMGRPRKHLPFTDAEIAEMVSLYESGRTLPSIAKGMRGGIPHNMVRKAIMPHVAMRKKGGIRSSAATRVLGDPLVQAEIIALYTTEHWSTVRLAKKFGSHPPRIGRMLVAAGVKLRPSHVGGSRRNQDAIAIVNAAVRAGDLVRGPCSVCGKSGRLRSGIPAVIAHHNDYNLPLDIIWFCGLHHRIWHQNNMAFRLGEGPNASVGVANILEGLAKYGLYHQTQLDDDSVFQAAISGVGNRDNTAACTAAGTPPPSADPSIGDP